MKIPTLCMNKIHFLSQCCVGLHLQALKMAYSVKLRIATSITAPENRRPSPYHSMKYTVTTPAHLTEVATAITTATAKYQQALPLLERTLDIDLPTCILPPTCTPSEINLTTNQHGPYHFCKKHHIIRCLCRCLGMQRRASLCLVHRMARAWT